MYIRMHTERFHCIYMYVCVCVCVCVLLIKLYVCMYARVYRIVPYHSSICETFAYITELFIREQLVISLDQFTEFIP